MKPFDVQSTALPVAAEDAFAFLAQPQNLPKWTNAFARADEHSAELSTPAGNIAIELKTHADPERGTIDWEMIFPDGSQGHAYSRVTQNGEGHSIYAFVLMAPPGPLETLEGALDAQKPILAQELKDLSKRLAA